MAGLRDNFNVSVEDPRLEQYVDAAQAQGMGSLARGWEAGRIGNDLNPLHTEALNAEIAGDLPRAKSLRDQIDILQKRQQLYAPTVGRVEDVGGVGDALSYAAGQVGQGVASMADPMAVSAGLGVVGRVAGAIPHPFAQGVSRVAQAGQFVAPYMMSKRQLSGEFIGNANEDKELMARTSPTALRDAADNYGYLAAVPDSALPGIVGRQVTGLSRAKGAARKAAFGPGVKTLAELGGEGGTEALQSEMSHQALGMLNPNRDTSGDEMENVNSFVGGAIGGGPFAAAGAYGEAAHNRVGAGVDRVKDAAGTVIDMAKNNETLQAGVNGVKKAANSVKGGVIDLMSDEDGKVSGQALVDNLKAGAQDLQGRGKTALDEHNILSGTPPADIVNDDDKLVKWFGENDAKRAQLVADKLQAMDDPEAAQHLEAIQNPDPEAQSAAIESAAQFVLSKSPIGRAQERAATLGENLGKIAGVVGPAIGKGAVAAGKAAVSFGKSVLGGAKDGMRKKNEQADVPAEESFMAWRDRVYGTKGEETAAAALDAAAKERADLAGNYVGDMAKRLSPKKPEMAVLARHAAFTLADVAMTTGAKGGVATKNIKLNRLTEDLHGAFGAEAPEVLQQLGDIMGPKAKPLIEYMSKELEQRMSPRGRVYAQEQRDVLAKQVVGLVNPKAQNALMKQGVNLNTPGGRERVLDIMEDFADKISSAPHARKALNDLLGADSVDSILGLLNGEAEKKEKISPGKTVDDRNTTATEGIERSEEDEDMSDFAERSAEKMVVKGSGPKVYGFHSTANLRTNSERRDMFGATDKPGEDGVVKRPNLFVKGQKLVDGRDAIEKKIADVKAQLAEDPDYPDHDSHRVEAKSALDVMKESGMQPGKILQLYRDYMRMDAANEKLSDGQRKYANQQAGLAHGMILDAINKKDADGKLQKFTFKTTPRDRSEMTKAATDYFKERYVVVGEQLSNRDPSKMSVAELLDMHKEGQGLIERSRLAENKMEALSDANILMFKSDAVKGGEVAIPAGKLVRWVREQRGKSEASNAEDTSGSFSNRSKNEEYLTDVSEGIAALIGSGKVKGMPYKVNKRGNTESFTKGIPDSLRLANQTYGEMMYGRQTNRTTESPSLSDEDIARREDKRYTATAAKHRFDAVMADPKATDQDKEEARFELGEALIDLESYTAIDGEKVAQDQKRIDEFFTPEDRTERDMVESAWSVGKRRRGKNDTSTAASATSEDGELVTRGPNNTDINNPSARGTSTSIRVDVSGKVAPEPKTDETDKTPLDFSKAQKGGVPDEFANQRWLSRQTGASTDAVPGPEPKGTAVSSAPYRAQAIGEAFLKDPQAGLDMIKMRIRSAMRPAYSKDKNALVGGVHYIAPVASFINADNLAQANVDMPAKTIVAIQQKVANILLKGDVSPTEKVKIARLMLGDEAKVTAMNVDAKLGRIISGTPASEPMTAKPAPEVANAGLPKDRLTLSGTNERKLNAMAVDIHTDLQRGGFAATHDSPIRHEGKFNWRAHSGKGEGNASFGAGTYLSTSDGVHSSYKGQFTADVSAGPTELHNKMMQIDHELSEAQDDLRFKADFLNEGERMGDPDNWVSSPDGSLTYDGRYNFGGEQVGSLYTLEKAFNRYELFIDDEFQERVNDLQEFYESNKPSERDYAQYKKLEEKVKQKKLELAAAKEAIKAAADNGFRNDKSPTYEVSVDIKPEQLLNWNERLEDQPKILERIENDKLIADMREEQRDPRFRQADALGEMYGNELYEGLVSYFEDEIRSTPDIPNEQLQTRRLRAKAQMMASDYLQSLGILGHKYAASGGKNDVHPNYVIYDDSKITTNYVHFNAQEQAGPSKVSTQEERDAAVAYAHKVLGPKIKVDFKDITGYSGEFIDAKNVIEIATAAAAGTMNTLYHEAMHVFFRDFVKGNPKVQVIFESLINDPKHLQKLHDLLDGYPAAQAQLTSGEERLAYTYQFWKAGLLQVDAKAQTWLQKIGKFFRQVLGRVRDSERALELFEAFDQGKMSEPSAAGKVIAKALDRGTNALKLRRQMDAMLQGLAAMTLPAAEILSRSVSPTARKLSTMMFTNPGDEAHGTEGQGLMNARRHVAQQYVNVANRKFESMSELDKAAVQKHLQSETDPATIKNKEHREAVADIRNLLDRFHTYMTDAGLKIGKIENYYPVVWNPNLLNANKAEFVNMLVTKYAEHLNPLDGNIPKAAERVWQSLVNKDGVDAHLPVNREDGVLTPFFASQGARTLPWLDGADREKYLDKDMQMTLTRYFNQGAHAAEYHRRFGEKGVKLDRMLADIRTELSGASKEMVKRGEIKDEKARVKWVSRQMRDVSQSVGAMEGTLGKDISPNMRKFNSYMAVYQNIRLLPMALFSSFVDPLAIVARSGDWNAAYETFVYSMREVFRGWADAFKDLPPERQKDKWREIAEFIGASEIAMFQHHVSDEYSSTYMTPGAKKLNDKMFVFNGMEAWNRGNRIMATKYGVQFIERHAKGDDKNHSTRWLKELGLTAAAVPLNADGELITTPQELSAVKGISLDEARKEIAPIHDAINRFVEGAVLTPNAAQRPGWSSDPRLAPFFHLKQFSYSFHQTILKRAANEIGHGNMAPLGALAMFIPTMIGADIMKGLIQGGGSLPPYMAGMNAGDWVMHGAQRAGLSGIGVIGMDAANDWASLGGPAFEQIVDAGRDGFGSRSAMKAMPLHALYENLVTSPGA